MRTLIFSWKGTAKECRQYLASTLVNNENDMTCELDEPQYICTTCREFSKDLNGRGDCPNCQE